MQQAAPPQPETTPSAVACPHCGAAAAPDQLFCLECGERIGLAYRRPPSWRLPAAIVGAVVLLAGAALAIALVEIADDAEQIASAPGPTAAAPAAPQPAEPAPAQTAAPEPEQPGTEEEPPAPSDEDAAPGSAASWPANTSAYTVILLSTDNRGGAEARARAAVEAGIPAGVLRSGDYSSLNPGFWVVFGGQFDSTEQAQQEAERYASLGFPGAYPRFVNGGG